MAKQICFKYKGVDYTLEFTRRTVETLETRGFALRNIADKPMTTLPTLFAGAFLAHHRFTKQETIDEIFASMRNRDQLIDKLAEMYREPIDALMDEPEESEGNVDWGASW